MKKTIICFIVLLITITINAQKIKVKKGIILLDKKSIGRVEKIKKQKKQPQYTKIYDTNGKHIFTAKKVTEPSKYFAPKNSISYFIIECIEEKDTIGIENPWFHSGEKMVAKYLVKNKMLGSNGKNNKKVLEILANTNSKPKYVIEEINNAIYYKKNKSYIVNRDKTQPIFVKKGKAKTESGLFIPATIIRYRYNIYQKTKDPQQNILIGYAVFEGNEFRKVLIFYNLKDTPIAIFNNFDLFSFDPYTKMNDKVKLGEVKHFNDLYGAIIQNAEILIKKNKL